jgi:predicted esterase
MAEKQSKKNKPVLGMILQSPLLSAFRVAFHFRVTMPGDMFPNVDRAPNITGTPVLIIHGTKDEVVPIWHGHVRTLTHICTGVY